MKREFYFVFLLSFLSLMAQAQTFQTWNWELYKIKFKAPSNLEVQKNNQDVYEARNQYMALDIYPRKGENLSYDGMKNAVINWANSLGMSYNTVNTSGDAQPIYMSNINRYWGCAIDGNKNGYSASILLLVDPDYPDISFYIWLSYANEYYHDAIAILKSFSPM